MTLIFHYTCGSTPKRVVNGGEHRRGIAPGAMQKRRSGGESLAAVYSLTDVGIEPRPPEAMSLTTTI